MTWRECTQQMIESSVLSIFPLSLAFSKQICTARGASRSCLKLHRSMRRWLNLAFDLQHFAAWEEKKM